MTEVNSKRPRLSNGESSKDNSENDSDEIAFIIKCKGDATYKVSVQTREQLEEACDYFRTIFRHDMLESSTQVINKPDWSHRVLVKLFELVLKGTISVTNLLDLVAVTSAADQILLPYDMYSPFEQGRILAQRTKSAFLELADPDNAVFTFQGPARILNDWKKWLNLGLFHSVDWKMFVVTRQDTPNDLRHNQMGRSSYFVHSLNCNKWNVHAYCAVTAVQHMCRAVKKVTVEPDEEEFYKLGILHPCDSIWDQLAVTIAQATGGRRFTATFWESVSTLCGPFKILYNGFRSIRKYLKQNMVILRIKTSTPAVVDSIIQACCLHCEDHQGSIGIDITGSIVLVKTIFDMSNILLFLAKTAPEGQLKNGDTDLGSDGKGNGDNPEKVKWQHQDLFQVRHVEGDCFVMDPKLLDSF
ncbi:MAG: hypothetical protein SGBAC_013549 [Bacillariaceae sp.]